MYHFINPSRASQKCGVFCLQKKGSRKMEGKTVYCPICKRKTGTYNGLTDSLHISRCRKCNKRVIYNPLTRETTCKPFPEKNTSSGVSFC